MTDLCAAPDCTRPVEAIVRGEDFDGTRFEDRVCGSCGCYVLEAGTEVGKWVELVPLPRLASDERDQ